MSSLNWTRPILQYIDSEKELRVIEIHDIRNIFEHVEISFESSSRGNHVFILPELSFYDRFDISVIIYRVLFHPLSISQSRTVGWLNINQKDIVGKNFWESRCVVSWRLVKADKVEGSIVIERGFRLYLGKIGRYRSRCYMNVIWSRIVLDVISSYFACKIKVSLTI